MNRHIKLIEEARRIERATAMKIRVQVLRGEGADSWVTVSECDSLGQATGEMQGLTAWGWQVRLIQTVNPDGMPVQLFPKAGE